MKNEKNEIRRVTFQIPEELYQDIMRLSEIQDRSISSLIRQALINVVVTNGE